MRIFLALILSLISFTASAQRGGSGTDSFTLNELWDVGGSLGFNNLNNSGNYVTAGKTLRPIAINPAVRTLVLLTAGASNGGSVGPSAYVAPWAALIDNFNMYNGTTYAPDDPQLGSTLSVLGPGSIGPKLSNLLIANGQFDRVILAPMSVGGARTNDWALGVLQGRLCVMMRRLASQGITPSTTGVTFGLTWNIGENEHGITAATYRANVLYANTILTQCGFVGRIFIPVETISANVADATIAGAQVGLVDNIQYFSAGNIDTLTGATNRQADGTHLTDAGQSSAATLMYNAMHASGAPY